MTLAWAQDEPAVRRFLFALRWLPALAGAAYLATVAAIGPGLVRALNWDTDISAPLTLAERLRGHGPVYLPHFGAWTTYWWLLATRGLPGHAALWEATGYVFAVASAALLAWATSRVAGRWAGVTAAAAALVVGPFALRALMTVIYHVTNPFTAAVLAAYLVLLTRTRSWLLALGVGLLAGANAASDPLLWIAGIAPFALAAALLARATCSLEVALRAAVMLAVTVVTAVATNLLMHGLGYRVIGLDVSLAPVHDWPANTLHLVRMAALLGGANYALPGGGYPQDPLRALVAVLVLAAIAAPVVAAVTLTVRRAEAEAQTYAWYWGAASALLCVVFVVTPNAAALGPTSVYYLLTLALAAGAGVALLAARSRRAQLAVALVVATVGATNIASIADGLADGLPPLASYERPLVRLLEREGATRGYAGYWDAQNLSWQSGMRLLVAPVTRCTATELCPYNFFTIRSWYEPHRGPSFLLLDATNQVIAGAPPFVRDATGSYRFGPLTLYVFDYDIARHVRLGGPPSASIARFGGGSSPRAAGSSSRGARPRR